MIYQTTNAPGTAASCSLIAAPTGRLNFRAKFATAAVCFYFLDDGTQNEWGYGTLTYGTPDLFSRDTVIGNSAGTTARLNFTASGVKIYNELPGENAVYKNNSGIVAITPNIQGAGGIDNTAIGATTRSSGAFTTLSATGTFTPAQTSGIVGTTTNNSASAGSVGEFVSASVASGSAVSLTSVTAKTVTSISLTAGDWDVWGNWESVTGGTTVVAAVICGLSTTTNTLVDPYTETFTPSTAGITPGVQAVCQRFLVATTTTVFLIAWAAFSTSTLSAYGNIYARRRR